MWKPYEPKHVNPEPHDVIASMERLAQSMGPAYLSNLTPPAHADVWPPASVTTARLTDPWWNVTK